MPYLTRSSSSIYAGTVIVLYLARAQQQHHPRRHHRRVLPRATACAAAAAAYTPAPPSCPTSRAAAAASTPAPPSCSTSRARSSSIIFAGTTVVSYLALPRAQQLQHLRRHHHRALPHAQQQQHLRRHRHRVLPRARAAAASPRSAAARPRGSCGTARPKAARRRPGEQARLPRHTPGELCACWPAPPGCSPPAAMRPCRRDTRRRRRALFHVTEPLPPNPPPCPVHAPIGDRPAEIWGGEQGRACCRALKLKTRLASLKF